MADVRKRLVFRPRVMELAKVPIDLPVLMILIDLAGYTYFYPREAGRERESRVCWYSRKVALSPHPCVSASLPQNPYEAGKPLPPPPGEGTRLL